MWQAWSPGSHLLSCAGSQCPLSNASNEPSSVPKSQDVADAWNEWHSVPVYRSLGPHALDRYWPCSAPAGAKAEELGGPARGRPCWSIRTLTQNPSPPEAIRCTSEALNAGEMSTCPGSFALEFGGSIWSNTEAEHQFTSIHA